MGFNSPVYLCTCFLWYSVLGKCLEVKDSLYASLLNPNLHQGLWGVRDGKRFFCISFYNTKFPLPNEGHCGHFQRKTMSHCGGSVRTLFHPIIRQCVVAAGSCHHENTGYAPVDLPGKIGSWHDAVGKLCCKSCKKISSGPWAAS